jgi:hypothetical protein
MGVTDNSAGRDIFLPWPFRDATIRRLVWFHHRELAGQQGGAFSLRRGDLPSSQ